MYRLVLLSVAAHGRGAEVDLCSMAAGDQQCVGVHEQGTAGVELMQTTSATQTAQAKVEDDAAGSPHLIPAMRMVAQPIPKLVPELKQGAHSSLTQVSGACHNTCHGRSCEFWQTHGYTCEELEGVFGCECDGCACKWPEPVTSPAPPPAPPSAPKPSPESGNCEGIMPTHHYPLPDQTYTEGLPSPMVASPDGISACDVQQLQADCVDRINTFRGGHPFSDGRERSHGEMDDLSGAPTDFAKCMNEKALSDLFYSEHQNEGCGHFSMSLDCELSIQSRSRAENSCCPRRCSSYDSCKRKLFQCLDQMWDEGKIVLDSGDLQWTPATGHYWNMLSTSAATAACGFGFDSEGNMLATQNFY